MTGSTTGSLMGPWASGSVLLYVHYVLASDGMFDTDGLTFRGEAECLASCLPDRFGVVLKIPFAMLWEGVGEEAQYARCR